MLLFATEPSLKRDIMPFKIAEIDFLIEDPVRVAIFFLIELGNKTPDDIFK